LKLGNLRLCSQRGAVLVTGLVMLILLMLVATAVIRMSMAHTQVVNNEQWRAEATAAANYALDAVLNASPDTWTKFEGAGTDIPVNIGLKGATDTAGGLINVRVKDRQCRQQRRIKNADLVRLKDGVYYVPTDDATCFGSPGGPLVITDPTKVSVPNEFSTCVAQVEEMSASVSGVAELPNTRVDVTQGVELRLNLAELEEDC
jgi:hypothetical protein